MRGLDLLEGYVSGDLEPGIAYVFGAESALVNGQLLAFPQAYQYAPTGYGSQTVGVPQVSPSYPPYLGGGSQVSAAPGMESVGGYGTAGNNVLATQQAGQAPFSLTKSPTLWAVVLLVVALVLLKAIHWRETIEESGSIGR